MWQRLREIIRKELKQTLREPRMRAMLVMPPLVQLIVFGYAVNMDVEHVSIAWMDQDRSPASRALLDEFLLNQRFQLRVALQNERDSQTVLDQGDVEAVVRVLPGFSSDLSRGKEGSVQILVDGSNSNTASLVAAQCASVVQRFSANQLADLQRRKLVGRAVDRPLRAPIPSLAIESRVWFNPELKSRNYFVPGVIVNIIMLVTLSLTSMSIVREKEIGTMEQLMVTPIRPIELILGKTLPFAVIGMLQLAFVTAVALVLFRVPLNGSPLLLAFSGVFFLGCSLGAGLFISTISHTQQQAMMTTLFFFQPAFMLSGFSFPIRNMPEVIQWITYLNPMRYFMEIVRGIFLKGVGMDVLWPQLTALAVLGSTILVLSAFRFHKSLD